MLTELTSERISQISATDLYSRVVCTPMVLDDASDPQDPSFLVSVEDINHGNDMITRFPSEAISLSAEPATGIYRPESRINAATRALQKLGIVTEVLMPQMADDGLLGVELPGHFALDAETLWEKPEFALPLLLVVDREYLPGTNESRGLVFMRASDISLHAAARGLRRLSQWTAAAGELYNDLLDPDGLPTKRVLLSTAPTHQLKPLQLS